jgi:hypothetical protein
MGRKQQMGDTTLYYLGKIQRDYPESGVHQEDGEGPYLATVTEVDWSTFDRTQRVIEADTPDRMLEKLDEHAEQERARRQAARVASAASER